MDRAILRLSAVVSGSFKALFSQFPLYFLISAGFAVISGLILILLGFTASLVLGIILGAASTAIICTVAIAQARGRTDLQIAATENFARSFVTFLIYSVVISVALFALLYGLFRILFPEVDPKIAQLGTLFWQAMQATSDSAAAEEEMAQLMLNFTPELWANLAGKVLLTLGFLVLLSLLIIALFAPFYGVVVNEGLTTEAWRRSIDLGSGYRLKLVGIFIVLNLIVLGVSFALGIFAGIFQFMFGPQSPITIILTQVIFAPVSAWILIAVVHLYLQLRITKGEDQTPCAEDVFA